MAVLMTVGAVAPVAARHNNDDENRDKDRLFDHVATFDIVAGNGSSVAEIVDTAFRGRLLVYTDGGKGEIGLVDISNPRKPKGLGTIPLPGEPTSLVVKGRYAIVATSTSPDFVNPSGKLVVVNLLTRQIVEVRELGGQPDSVALAPDGKRAAIVIENERDEDLNGGLIPQLPTGGLLIVELSGHPSNWTIFPADLSPVAANAFVGEDLEPEFVDINEDNEAVVSFQENNHIAIVDLVTGTTINNFSAGSAKLKNVDTIEDDLIILDSDITKRREPDAVAWIDDDSAATANEGDYEDENGEEGGSRGFTIFNQDGTIEYESAESFEHLLVSAGHYNEGRSENKGIEPEALEYGAFGRQQILFVGSERSNAVGVYDVAGDIPELLQTLPTGIAPEGLKAIPQRDLFVASTEEDEEDVVAAGIPAQINIYQLKNGKARYPMIASVPDDAGLPIGWVALSDLVGDPWDADTLYTVSDAFLAEGFVYTVDVSKRPALITDRLQIVGVDTPLDRIDLEGIAVGQDGDFWLASEGRPNEGRPNLVLKVDPLTGEAIEEIGLPPELEAGGLNNGFEGIAVTGDLGAEMVYVAVQRAWPNAGDTDEVNTKIGRYDVATGTWGFVHYPLEPEGLGDWIGLSSLTLLPDGSFAVIERDKGWGPTTPFNAELKAIYGIDLAGADFRAFDDPRGLVTIDKHLLIDVLPELEKKSIWTAEKLEGFAVAADGKLFAVTDNDGVDDAPGETIFLRLDNDNNGGDDNNEEEDDEDDDGDD
jgi:hypothetical protein